ncbi:MAG TPA: hypothetical protein VFJ43_02065 [Bacteroidia bacterium]|nr:hypothetical protein [Bacteroidia bacterium]
MKNKITFKKGQCFDLRYIKTDGNGHRSTERVISGNFEIIRNGKTVYLFCSEKGIDLFMTRDEIKQAIDNFNNPDKKLIK